MEETLRKAIEEITYASDRYPEDQFRIISENKEQAIPYLRAAIKKAVKEQSNLEENYELHFYALFFLGQFREKSCFPLIMQLASVDSEVLDYLLGDAITENLADILYITYNGDLEIIKEAVKNPALNEYARSGMLRVMGQLYLDGNVAKEELQEFIRQIVNEEEEIGDYIYSELAILICQCHFIEMLPELWKLYESDRADPFVNGYYEDCVDQMFQYEERRLCEESIDVGIMRGWAMFKQESKTQKQKKLTEKDLREFSRMLKLHQSAPHSKKVGRNDPCPCGSGKKYKKCCLNKPQTSGDMIESEQEWDRWLKNYPPSAKERQEGRIYLEDFYDAESIEIDKMLYLALMERPEMQNASTAQTARDRTRRYLEEAFSMFLKKKAKDKIKTFQEYDRKCSIHYHCKEWLDYYRRMLESEELWEMYQEVEDCCDEME